VRIRFAKQKTVFPKFSLCFYFLNHLPCYREASSLKKYQVDYMHGCHKDHWILMV